MLPTKRERRGSSCQTSDTDDVQERHTPSADSGSISLFPQWPSTPERLGEVTTSSVIGYVADAILVLAPVLFIGKHSEALCMREAKK
jgi:hypothetical protein